VPLFHVLPFSYELDLYWYFLKREFMSLKLFLHHLKSEFILRYDVISKTFKFWLFFLYLTKVLSLMLIANSWFNQVKSDVKIITEGVLWTAKTLLNAPLEYGPKMNDLFHYCVILGFLFLDCVPLALAWFLYSVYTTHQLNKPLGHYEGSSL